MLATQVGAGLYMIVRDRLMATVSGIVSIKCPICLVDNVVTPIPSAPATIMMADYGVPTFTGAGPTVREVA